MAKGAGAVPTQVLGFGFCSTNKASEMRLEIPGIFVYWLRLKESGILRACDRLTGKAAGQRAVAVVAPVFPMVLGTIQPRNQDHGVVRVPEARHRAGLELEAEITERNSLATRLRKCPVCIRPLIGLRIIGGVGQLRLFLRNRAKLIPHTVNEIGINLPLHVRLDSG